MTVHGACNHTVVAVCLGPSSQNKAKQSSVQVVSIGLTEHTDRGLARVGLTNQDRTKQEYIGRKAYRQAGPRHAVVCVCVCVRVCVCVSHEGLLTERTCFGATKTASASIHASLHLSLFAR